MNEVFRKYALWIILGAAFVGYQSYIVTNKSPVVPTAAPDAIITDGAGSDKLPTEIETGENLILKSDKSVASTDPGSVKWIVSPPERMSRVAVFDNGRTLSLPSGRKIGSIQVTLVVAKGDQCDYQTFDLNVVDPESNPVRPEPIPIRPTPRPLPEPIYEPVTPKPVPAPVPEKPKTQLEVFKTEMAKLELPGMVKTEIKAVANAFRTVGKQIDNGTITEVKSLMTNTSEEIQTAIGLNGFVLWLPWRTRMITLLESAKVQTFKEHGQYWSAIAEVLESKVPP